jgi:8-oxo-dGTP pyrophosphatase MutT (NUDIX family)
MRWTVHGERRVYESAWMNVALVDVEIPGGDRFEHHVLRMPQGAAGVVIHDAARGLLMLWRHRFITDTWGWEIPAGRIDEGEEPAEAAKREAREESGWDVDDVVHLVTFHPSNGTSDQKFHVFLARGARHVGEPTDPGESERIEWLPVSDIPQLIASGLMQDGLTLTGVLAALTLGDLERGAGDQVPL